MAKPSVYELKHTLVAVIVVYLVVDFATDVAQESASLTWDTLVRPISIVLIAGALWLLSLAQSKAPRSNRATEGMRSLTAPYRRPTPLCRGRGGSDPRGSRQADSRFCLAP